MVRVPELGTIVIVSLSIGCGQQPEATLTPSPSSKVSIAMPHTLQARAKAYLSRPIPDAMPYVEDNLTDGIISRYATDGKIDNDPELMELIELCAMEAETAALNPERPRDQQELFRESAEILRAILIESRKRR